MNGKKSIQTITGGYLQRAILLGAVSTLVLSTIVATPVLADSGDPGRSPYPWEKERGHGWTLGLQFMSDFVRAEDPIAGSTDGFFIEETGGGALLHVGYDFSPTFGLRLALGGARHETSLDDVDLAHASATLEAHFRFQTGQRGVPYIFGGIGGSTLEIDSGGVSSETKGGVAVMGLGVLYHVSRSFSIDLSGRLDLINWDEIEVTRSSDGTETRLTDPVDESGSAGKILFGFVVRL